VKKLLGVSLFLLFFTVSVLVCRVSASDEALAASAISQSEEVVASAYEAVLEAEQVGANVSGLLARLDDAGELLAEAKVALGLGEFDYVVFLAEYCSEIGGDVRDEADELRVEAYGSRIQSSRLTMVGSTVGVVCVVVGSFWGWRVFKRRYFRRVLGMKPEVATDES